MAGFHTKTFQKYDDYVTPFSAWESIKQYIPNDKVLWEAFYCDGESGSHLSKLGFNVIHENEDFFENNKGDILVSNPPFTIIPSILQRLKNLDKPFILIMPSSKLNTQYFRKLFSNVDEPMQIIIPRKRIQFIRMKDGKVDETAEKKCNFDCFYYCYKLNLPRDIIWLENH